MPTRCAGAANPRPAGCRKTGDNKRLLRYNADAMDEITRDPLPDAGAVSDFAHADRFGGQPVPGADDAVPADSVSADGAPVESAAPESAPVECAPAEVGAVDAVELPPADAAGISDEERAAAVAAEQEIAEIEAEEVVDGEELPPVPELRDAAAVAKVVFVLLLSTREGLSLFRLAQACNTTQKLVDEALAVLAQNLQQLGVAVELTRHGDTVRLMSQPDAFPYLQRLRGVKRMEKLSPAALETLAVIAYQQPVMRSQIEAIRGVKAGPMLRTLLQHKLVRVTGRADVPGRPLQYGTTQQFLERFGLQSLQDLPSHKEWKNLG